MHLVLRRPPQVLQPSVVIHRTRARPQCRHPASHRVLRGVALDAGHQALGDMSTQNDNAAKRPQRGGGLGSLVQALQSVGDAASSATSAGGDVRLHVIACRAHHLASHLAQQEGFALRADATSEGARNLHEAAQALRQEVVSLAAGRPGIRPVLVQARGLVLLADAIQR